jgi:POT family proton-dependent oligopeptide transporter
MAWFAAAGVIADAAGRIPRAWAPGFHVLSNIGYVYFAPIAIALFARSVPAAVNPMMVGV